MPSRTGGPLGSVSLQVYTWVDQQRGRALRGCAPRRWTQGANSPLPRRELSWREQRRVLQEQRTGASPAQLLLLLSSLLLLLLLG